MKNTFEIGTRFEIKFYDKNNDLVTSTNYNNLDGLIVGETLKYLDAKYFILDGYIENEMFTAHDNACFFRELLTASCEKVDLNCTFEYLIASYIGNYGLKQGDSISAKHKLCFLERYILSYKDVCSFIETNDFDISKTNIDKVYGGKKF